MAPGHDDDAPRIFLFPERLQDLDPRQTRQDHIQDNQIGRRFLHDAQRLVTILHPERPISAQAQKLNQQIPHERIIVDDQH